MDKKTVWISACVWIFFHAAACCVCATLPPQITECLQSIRKGYTTYYFVKGIILLAVSVALGITNCCWPLNAIYLLGVVISPLVILDVFPVWLLLHTCDTKPTDHVGIITVNILHSVVGCIGLVVICVWYIRGSQKNQSNVEHTDEESQLEDLESYFERNYRDFITPTVQIESETQRSGRTNNNVATNKTHVTTIEDDIQAEDDTTEESKLNTSSADKLITQNSCKCSSPNRKKQKRDTSKKYHRNNSVSKETQTDSTSTDEDNTSLMTCRLRGISPSEQTEAKYINGDQAAVSITTTPWTTGDNEQVISFKQHRILRKEDFASRADCQDCFDVDCMSCKCFKEHVPG